MSHMIEALELAGIRVTPDAENGIVIEKDYPDGKTAVVMRMLYGNGRIAIGKKDSLWYDDAWCYDGIMLAIASLVAWDRDTQPEPYGWKRHPESGRRRPSGDAAKEYVNP